MHRGLYGFLCAKLNNCSAVGLDLVLAMLQEEPSKRISAKRALQHPYITRTE